MQTHRKWVSLMGLSSDKGLTVFDVTLLCKANLTIFSSKVTAESSSKVDDSEISCHIQRYIVLNWVTENSYVKQFILLLSHYPIM